MSEWATLQQQLEQMFIDNGCVERSIGPIVKAENDYRQYARSFHGHRILTDSFLSFFIDSILLAQRRTSNLKQDCHAFNILTLSSNFRRFRAANILFLNGHPLSGYALLRDLKDTAISLSAIANGSSSFDKLVGYGPNVDTNTLNENTWSQLTRNRKKEEWRIRDMYFGSKSLLTPDEVKEIDLWEQLFHAEVHGSRLTMATSFQSWTNRSIASPLLSYREESAAATFMNRCSETGWMLHRLLPTLQYEAGEFGAEWATRWCVLDTSFRFMVEDLSRDLNKPIGDAVSMLIDKYFTFSPDATSLAKT